MKLGPSLIHGVKELMCQNPLSLIIYKGISRLRVEITPWIESQNLTLRPMWNNDAFFFILFIVHSTRHL